MGYADSITDIHTDKQTNLLDCVGSRSCTPRFYSYSPLDCIAEKNIAK